MRLGWLCPWDAGKEVDAMLKRLLSRKSLQLKKEPFEEKVPVALRLPRRRDLKREMPSSDPS